jgi:hypothetical protein
MLLKIVFPVFVALPIGAALIRSRSWRALARVSIPCILLAGPWYALHWRGTVNYAIASGYGELAAGQGTGPILSVAGIAAYLGLVAERGVSFYYAAVTACAGLVVLLRRQFQALRRISPLARWLAPFLIFWFGGNKDIRYIAPILPAFALAAACLLDSAVERWRLVAPVVIPIVLAFPLVSLLAVSFHWPYTAPDLGYASYYDPNTWLHDEILRVIADSALVRPGEKKLVLLGTDRGRNGWKSPMDGGCRTEERPTFCAAGLSRSPNESGWTDGKFADNRAGYPKQRKLALQEIEASYDGKIRNRRGVTDREHIRGLA